MGALLIGIGKRGGKPGMPPPERPAAKETPKPGDPEGGDGSDKATPERAIVIRAGDHCIACENYHPDSGECDEVDGVFEPDDACYAYFEAMKGGEEPEPGEAPAQEPGAAAMEAKE